MKPDACVVVLSTVSSAGEGEKISKALVRSRMAACVNIVPGIKSIYRWKGRLESSRETLLVVKTLNKNLAAVMVKIRQLHSYELPEVIALPVTGGSREYLSWLSAQCRK